MAKRGAVSGMGGGDSMAVPYGEWGERLNGMNAEPIYNENGEMIGEIVDSELWFKDPVIEKATKKQAIDEAFSYKNDDGTFGDDDIQIYATYADGSSWSSDSGQNKGLKKSGLIGISVSTPDSETAWGEDFIGRGRDRRRVPNRLSYDPDTGEEGPANSTKWYKITGKQLIRQRIIYNNQRKDGRYYTTRETIRQSTIEKT